MRFNKLAALSLVSFLAACGGGAGAVAPKALSPENKSGKMDSHGHAVSKEAAAGFDRALDEFADHDKRQDWAADSCKSVAQSFEEASSAQKSATNRDLPEALYNEGLAHQRCGDGAGARDAFERAVSTDPGFHRAKAQLALYDFQKSGDLDSTIEKLDQIIRDAKFQNVEALVSLAALQMQRNNDEPNQDGKDDLERARKNLQRSLAIDDSYMPALNQLAIYYLEQAKAKAGEKKRVVGKRGRGLVVSGGKKALVNEQQLDLAALVAGQAVKKNPNYAPIHNTSGLILVELRNYNQAVQEFGKAAKLDPNFFEAHMNYAAVNLSFRGFQEAEKAYRQALKLHPDEFEAHLGLALAIRGQIQPGQGEKLLEDAQKELDAAKKIAPDRPEPYYNEAILTQEFRAKSQGDQAIPTLEKAAEQYKAFIAKAGDDAVFAEAVKRSKERTQDITDTVKFIKEGIEAKRQQDEFNAQSKKLEEEQKAKDAQDAKDKAAADKAAAAAGDKDKGGDKSKDKTPPKK